MTRYVCWTCREARSTRVYREVVKCRRGHNMQYLNSALPRSRDDHKMWKLAEQKYRDGRDRPRRRHGRATTKLADWERQLLKVSKK